jgi:hypothetical protein
VQKAYTKLQSFHTLFGEDSQVFTEDEEVMHYGLNQQINGEESPFEKYVFELKEYRNAHPDRFAQIAETENGLELAISPKDNCSYFLVRNPQISGLFLKVDADLNCTMLSEINTVSLGSSSASRKEFCTSVTKLPRLRLLIPTTSTSGDIYCNSCSL